MKYKYEDFNDYTLEESSEIIKMIIPRMIDDALRLTIDDLFPPTLTDKWKNINGEYKSNFKVNGYKVIIAHIERYRWIKEKDVVYFKNEGALIQVNAASLLGKEGFKIKRLTKKLIKHNLVDFIASDTHSFRESKLDVVSKKIKNKELFNKNLFESEKIKVNS